MTKNKVVPMNLKKDGEIAYRTSLRVVEGFEVCRIVEIEDRLDGLRKLYTREINEKGKSAIITQALYLKDVLQRIKDRFFTDMELWANMELSTGQMIDRWYNHNAVGVVNDRYKTLELNTEKSYYVQFGSGN